MKKLILLAVVALALTVAHSDTNKFKPKKFQVTYSVQFNSITLQEAADLERRFQKLFDDACKISVAIEPVAEYAITVSGISYQMMAAPTDTLSFEWIP